MAPPPHFSTPSYATAVDIHRILRGSRFRRRQSAFVSTPSRHSSQNGHHGLTWKTDRPHHQQTKLMKINARNTRSQSPSTTQPWKKLTNLCTWGVRSPVMGTQRKTLTAEHQKPEEPLQPYTVFGDQTAYKTQNLQEQCIGSHPVWLRVLESYTFHQQQVRRFSKQVPSPYPRGFLA